MKVGITGADGFIGRAVRRAVQEAGHEVRGFDRHSGDDVCGSLEVLRKADAIIHLAGVLGTAELFDDAENAVEVNVLGTLNVLKWCDRNNARYIGITMPDVFPSVYTATKVCAKRLASAWHLAYGVPVSHVCAFNAYGPGQKYGPGHPQKILPTFAKKAWANEPIPIWGDGTQTVDLVHVDDLGRLFAEALNHGDDVTFDGGTGLDLSVNEVARKVIEITGSKAEVEYLPMRKGEIPTHIVATGEGWDRLDGWKPMFDMERFTKAVESYK